MSITLLETSLVTLAPARGRVSLTNPTASAPTQVVTVKVHTEGPHVGLGFAPVPVAGTAVHGLIETHLTPLLIGEDPFDTERLYAKAQRLFRPVGWAGLAARAYAAVDIALWDLKAKLAGLPLWRLLGGARPETPCFAGDLAQAGSDPAAAVSAARPLLDKGVMGVAIEVGGGDVQQDADRVQQVRDGLGEDAWLGISVDGRYDLGTALAMAHFYEEDVGIDWLDFPIPVEDREGYRRLADRMEVPLAVGSSFDIRDEFRQVLDQGAVRVLRPDLLRLGGITPFLKVAALAEAYPVAVVPVRLPEIGVHLACGLANVRMAEAGGWLAGLFTSPLACPAGRLVPPGAPGHGLDLRL